MRRLGKVGVRVFYHAGTALILCLKVFLWLKKDDNMELMKALAAGIFLIVVLFIINETKLIERIIDNTLGLILFLPRRFWEFLNSGNRLIFFFVMNLLIFIIAFFFNDFDIDIYGGYAPTLTAISVSAMALVLLVKLLVRLVGVFGPGRMPFWTGHIRHIPKDQTVV